MPRKSSAEPPAGVLELPSALDLAAAAPLLQELRDRRGGPLTVDGSNVQRLGGLCLQVLLAAKEAWRADGCDFRLQASDAMAQGLRQMGANKLWEEAA
jgi:chemotaxis protein CheX